MADNLRIEAPMAKASDNGDVSYEFWSMTIPEVATWTHHISKGINEALMSLNRHGPIEDIRLIVDEPQESLFTFYVRARVRQDLTQCEDLPQLQK